MANASNAVSMVAAMLYMLVESRARIGKLVRSSAQSRRTLTNYLIVKNMAVVRCHLVRDRLLDLEILSLASQLLRFQPLF